MMSSVAVLLPTSRPCLLVGESIHNGQDWGSVGMCYICQFFLHGGGKCKAGKML